MSYWQNVLDVPPTGTEWLILGCVILLFAVLRRPRRKTWSCLSAMLVYVLIISAMPHVQANGLFSFHDFGRTLFAAPFGLLLSRLVLIAIGVIIFRHFVERALPRKLFFKD